ncbi:hypothetical protein [Bacillus sp. 166amftsu]|nr:hypothetical protein [Bacillus sp. 166amftsu]SDY59602.1 hypothetical protein SAMN04488156_1011160 [Bacillus sp. 166amftsu]
MMLKGITGADSSHYLPSLYALFANIQHYFKTYCLVVGMYAVETKRK